MKRRVSNLINNRSARAGLFLLVGLFLVVALQDQVYWLFDQSDEYDGMSYEAFWSHKKYSNHDADVVILGDSQVGVGLSPEAIRRQLPRDMKVYNYAFGGGGLTPFIYEKAEKNALTERADKARVIVIGVTPLSLSSHPMAVDDEHYHQIEYVSPLETLIKPVSLEQVMRNLSGNNWKPAKTILYDNGWFPFNEEGSPDQHYDSRVRLFTKHKLLPERIEALMNQVKKWNDEGIVVVGLKLPVYEKVEIIERELIGFNTKAFIAEFEEKGGVWYSVPDGDYKRYNCCHLHITATESISSSLGEFIAEVIQSPDRRRMQTCKAG